MSAGARFGAVIVNYRCAPLALDAALSFLGDGGGSAVIVDNASSDGSLDYFANVLDGRARHEPQAPPQPLDGKAVTFADVARLEDDALTVIAAPRNGGFAYGCNTGLRRLSATPRLDRYLLLNPDALVAKGALDAFAERLADDSGGLCGATVVGFEAPHRVQAFGGAHLDPVFLTGRNIGEGDAIDEAPARADVEARLSYPLGPAIALKRNYLARAGYLDERYFLYYEEADWTLAGGVSNRPVWAPGAVIYHRYGSASKSVRTNAGAPSERSPLSDYHMTRSRIRFAAKWRPLLAPLAVAAGGAQALMRLSRGRARNAAAVFRASLPWSSREFNGA